MTGLSARTANPIQHLTHAEVCEANEPNQYEEILGDSHKPTLPEADNSPNIGSLPHWVRLAEGLNDEAPVWEE